MIYHCDCLVGFQLYDDESVQLIFTDPPFGVDYKNTIYDDSKENVFNLIDKWIAGMYRVLENGSHLYIFVPTLEIDEWILAVKKKFVFKNLLTFEAYGNGMYVKNNFGFNSQHIIYAGKGKAKRLNAVDWIPTSAEWLNDSRNTNAHEFTYSYPAFNKHYHSNIKANEHIKKLHPNQKNEELCKYLVELSTNVGDIVLDPFCGCGTIPLAAELVGRIGEGFEKNKEMYELAFKRYIDRDFSILKQEYEGDMLEI